jgi:hypothetical protein
MLRFLPDEIEALIALGEAEKAHSLLQPFLARAEALGRSWALAAAERSRGLLAASQGELPEALAAFDRALEHHARWRSPSSSGGRCSHRAKPSAERRSGGSRGTRSVGRWRCSSSSARLCGRTRPGRDREGGRSGSRSRRPDADGAEGSPTWWRADSPTGGGPGAVLERQHRRGEPPADLSEARRPVADRTVSEAGRAIGAFEPTGFVRCSETRAAPPFHEVRGHLAYRFQGLRPDPSALASKPTRTVGTSDGRDRSDGTPHGSKGRSAVSRKEPHPSRCGAARSGRQPDGRAPPEGALGRRGSTIGTRRASMASGSSCLGTRPTPKTSFRTPSSRSGAEARPSILNEDPWTPGSC